MVKNTVYGEQCGEWWWWRMWLMVNHVVNLVVKMNIFQTPPPPQDFLVVLWWILIQKYILLLFFVLYWKLLWWILWSCGKNENILIPTPHHKIFLWSCGENENILIPSPTTRFSCGLVVNSDTTLVVNFVVKLKIFWYPPPITRFSRGLVVNSITKFIYEKYFLHSLKHLVANLVILWWKWNYSIPLPHDKSFSWSCGEFYYIRKVFSA